LASVDPGLDVDFAGTVRLVAAMRRLLAASILIAASPAAAMVGNAPPPPAALARHVVMFTGSGGTFCTATAIARDLLLTAAHCIDPRNRYKLIQFSASGEPVLLDVASATRHPQFDIKAFLNHRATADVAVLKLAQPLPASYAPAPLAPAEKKGAVGDRLTVSGFGVSVRGKGETGGTLRAAALTVTGQPGSLQIRLVDPAGNNARPGMGACTGDSGAPAFDSLGAVIGVVSWSTAPNNEDGCGGLTGITPLARYRGWIVETIRGRGSN
jgi:secreted trypsin-like serine protease